MGGCLAQGNCLSLMIYSRLKMLIMVCSHKFIQSMVRVAYTTYFIETVLEQCKLLYILYDSRVTPLRANRNRSPLNCDIIKDSLGS